MTIPVIGIPCLNRADLLLRCIRSIDHAFDKLIIVNNGNDPGVKAVCEQLGDEYLTKLVIYAPGRNLGVAASWNWIIDSQPTALYWLLVGNDIKFTPGDLRKMNRFIRAHLDYVTMPANQGHSLFAVTQRGRDTIGAFDEGFWPAYLEDSDHMYRVKLANAKWSDVPDVHAIHGEAPTYGSHTIYADAELFRRNQETHRANFEYYKTKWGGAPGEETFIVPYNDPALSASDSRLPMPRML